MSSYALVSIGSRFCYSHTVCFPKDMDPKDDNTGGKCLPSSQLTHVWAEVIAQ